MSIHVHALVLTDEGIASSNRGETKGNNSFLQKVVWTDGTPRTKISAESIRFAFRNGLAAFGETNRYWDETLDQPAQRWKDPAFTEFTQDESQYLDDDLMGFMLANKAQSNDGDEDEPEDVKKAKKKAKKTNSGNKVRRSVIEFNPAISVEPFRGDLSFNVASRGASPSARKSQDKEDKLDLSTMYSTELHCTRYQFNFTMTPERLVVSKRAYDAIRAIVNLSRVGGSQTRYLYDFSPLAFIFRVTQDPSPRLLYGFSTAKEDKAVLSGKIMNRITSHDITPSEVYAGGDLHPDTMRALTEAGAHVYPGIKQTSEVVIARLIETMEA